MKQIFWSCWVAGLASLLLWGGGCSPSSLGGVEPSNRVFRVMGPQPPTGSAAQFTLTLEDLEAGSSQVVSSAYFDQAMAYRGSRFRAVSFSALLERFDPKQRADAVLLNCFDDYQGILSVAEIRRYGLLLATRIEIGKEFKPPDWLNPLLVIVPDGSGAPFMERFMTANIRELRFVRLEHYYAPVRPPGSASEARAGFETFKDNCLFCHSLKGVGGDKGTRLLDVYDFSLEQDRARFRIRFPALHNKENPDKQNVEQFVAGHRLEAVMDFLQWTRERPPDSADD